MTSKKNISEKTAQRADAIRRKKKKELFIKEVGKNPIISHTCIKVGVGRTTYYDWMKQDSKFAKKVKEASLKGIAILNDLALSKLVGQIQEGNFKAIKYWLDCNHSMFNTKHRIQIQYLASMFPKDEKKEIELTQEEKDNMLRVLGVLKANRRSRMNNV